MYVESFTSLNIYFDSKQCMLIKLLQVNKMLTKIKILIIKLNKIKNNNKDTVVVIYHKILK